MRSQPTLRPFDLAVSLRLVAVPGERYEPLADALGTSTSAVHRAVARLQHAGLCARGTRRVEQDVLRDFVVHGASIAFPPMTGPMQTGIPTAWAHPDLGSLARPGAGSVVWPSTQGTTQGQALVPLFQACPRVALHSPTLYRLLALVDAIRLMTPSERMAASGILEQQLQDAAPAG